MTTTRIELTQLGSGPAGAHGPDKLEAFPTSSRVAEIELTTAELICRCPVTAQPDVYQASIRYAPDPADPKALETKSVKLWLWSYQDRIDGVFAEDLAAELVDGVMRSPAHPLYVEVELVQNVRGGITTTVIARDQRGELE